MSGFIAMSRDALDHPALRDAERFRAWFWLIANAAWKPTRARIKGDTVAIERGELSFSVRFLADNWGWSKSRVDRFLSDLRDEGMIETRSKIGTTAGHSAGQGQSIITICNYDKYQSREKDERDNDKPHSGTTAGQQRDKEEQGNKETSNIGERDGARADCEIVVSKWNAMAAAHQLSRCEKMSGKRVKACHARLRDDGLDAICRAIEKIPGSSFLLGMSGDWSGANIDFLLRPDSITKILEGKYDDRSKTPRLPHGQNGSRKDGAAAALDRQLGLDDFAGSSGRCNVGESAGHSPRAIAGPRAVWG